MKKTKKTIFALGPGPSLLDAAMSKILHQISKSNIPILAFQKTFPYCKEYFDIIPDFWSFFDPSAALPGLRFLAKDSNLKTKVVLPSMVELGTPQEFRRYCASGGATALEYDSEGWAEYRSLLERLSNDQIIKKKADTIFRIQREDPLLFSQIDKKLSVPQRDGKVIFGTSLDPRKSPGAENKFSMVVLPLVRSMGFEKIITAGFDGLPGRFYQKQEPNDCRTKGFVGEYHYLNIWKEEEQKMGIKITSINERCRMSRVVGYQSIEELI